MCSQPSSPVGQARAIRVFVSSTFLDMQEERDELSRRVFPRLREQCEARGANWGDVDLRWGITSTEAREGRVLPICLAEIDECRPFFLAILGERYGWVPGPGGIDSELIDRLPWLAEQAGRSVTELEIQHGALRDGSARALFYLRDPGWIERRPAGVDRSEFISAHPEDRRRLAELKVAIRASGFPVRTFVDAVDLGVQVHADLAAIVEATFPPVPATAAERDTAAQRALVARLARAHVGRDEELGRLDRHAGSDRGPAVLVVTGEPGAGKSSLLAAWVERRARDDATSRSRLARWLGRGRAPTRRIAHFVGAAEEGPDFAAMLRGLVEALGASPDLSIRTPHGPIGLASAFANALSRAAVAGRLVLVIDGLDHLDPRGQGLGLSWLPERFPRGVRLVISAAPGPQLDELSHRRATILHLPPFDRQGRRRLVASYLWENHRKKLDESELDAIASAVPGGNAEFLRTIVEELRATTRGIEDLPERVATYAGSGSSESLFDQVLARLERECDGERPGLVRAAMARTWRPHAAGWATASSWTCWARPKGHCPLAYRRAMHLAIRPFAMSRSGLIGIVPPALRSAIQVRYLSRPDERVAVRRRLADYFGAQANLTPVRRGEALATGRAGRMERAGGDARRPDVPGGGLAGPSLRGPVVLGGPGSSGARPVTPGPCRFDSRARLLSRSGVGRRPAPGRDGSPRRGVAAARAGRPNGRPATATRRGCCTGWTWPRPWRSRRATWGWRKRSRTARPGRRPTGEPARRGSPPWPDWRPCIVDAASGRGRPPFWRRRSGSPRHRAWRGSRPT